MKPKYVAKKNRLIIDTGTSIDFIDTEKIIFCTRSDNAVHFQLDQQTPVNCPANFEEIQSLLTSSNFIAINQNYLINLKYLEQVSESEPDFIQMKGNFQIQIEKNRKQAIIQALSTMHR